MFYYLSGIFNKVNKQSINREDNMAIQPPRGTRDFMPADMIKREYLLDMVRAVFEDYGYQPLETPAFEGWELLSKKGGGGDSIKDELYCFRDKSGRGMGLRFDLTVPMARFVAANPQLPKPFKRYQIGRVWRYDRPQAGRFREFWQADADTVGSESMDCEAECLALAINTLMQLGFKKFRVRLNNRKILNGIVELAGVKKGKEAAVFRVLDKLDKLGPGDVRKELGRLVSPGKANFIMKAIERRGTPASILKGTSEVECSTVADQGLDELRELVEKCGVYGIKRFIEIDFSLVRGLDYYTGPIFEISIGEGRNLGSVAGGGRYDNLIELYGGKWTPATGISLGIERIFELMESGGMFKQPRTRSEVFVVAVDDLVRRDAVRLAQELRAKFANVETDLMGRDMKRQLAYANSQGIPFAVLVGPRELKRGRFTVREMKSGKQAGMTIPQMLKRFGKA
jgi:histidyl-tRNA synthetase